MDERRDSRNKVVGDIEDPNVPVKDWGEYAKLVDEGVLEKPAKLTAKKRPGYEFNVDKALDSVDLSFSRYTPSKDAIEFFNVIRLVLGEEPEISNGLMHYFLVDLVFGNVERDAFPYSKEVRDKIRINPNKVAILASRGTAKSTIVTTFLPIYLAVTGRMPNFGTVTHHVSLGDAQQSGAKVQAQSVRDFCEDSAFCKDYFEYMRFTDEECEFIRKGEGPIRKRAFLFKTKGAQTGIRGIRYRNERPQLITFDDIVKNEAEASSPLILSKLNSVLHSDATNALGSRGKLIAVNTPFNKKDPVYSLVENGVWTPVCIPMCEEIRLETTEEEFVGSWPQMHNYSKVMERFEDAYYGGTLRMFNQELMLRISSEEDKMIKEGMLQWYARKNILKSLANFTLLITTDFTASNTTGGDNSGIAVWAISANDDKFLLDLELRSRTIQDQYEALFRMVQKWGRGGRIIEVGVEVDGQQNLNIFALEQMMMDKNIWFRFAKQKGAGANMKGIRSKAVGGDKLERFKYMMPSFEMQKMHFPEELETTADMKEMMEELEYLTYESIGCVSADTSVYTQRGLVSIRDVVVGDVVVSQFGGVSANCKVTNAILSGIKETYTVSTGFGDMFLTANHRVLTARGYVEVQELTGDDLIVLGAEAWNKSKNTGIHGQGKPQGTINQQLLLEVNEDGCIGTLTNKRSGKFLQGWMYTTRTVINKITQALTWRYYQVQSTKSCTQETTTTTENTEVQNSKHSCVISQLRPSKENTQVSGNNEHLTKETSTGSASTVRKLSHSKTLIGMIRSTAQRLVSIGFTSRSAIKSMYLWGLGRALSAVTSTQQLQQIKSAVQQSVVENALSKKYGVRLKYDSARSAVETSRLGEIVKEGTVQTSVAELRKKCISGRAGTVEQDLLVRLQELSTAQVRARLAPVLSVRKRKLEVVYDLAVEGSANFAVEGSMIIHNSRKDDGLDLISQIAMIEYILPDSGIDNVAGVSDTDRGMWSDIWGGTHEEESGGSVIF